ncbi:MAG: hypothetical protein EAZ89_04035 [Bacteroidetes bacterium]|nr:MAG: hypothetical protein EAZ89_04035 [Bacteroidota bacterium]
MKRITIPTLLALVLLSVSGFAQEPTSFTNCAAAFLGSKMIVNDYSPEGTSQLDASATCILSVCQVTLNPGNAIPGEKTPFMIAIRDGNSKTLWMYATASFREIEISKVLAKCKKGDYIVLLTRDEQWALPHNEILVN